MSLNRCLVLVIFTLLLSQRGLLMADCGQPHGDAPAESPPADTSDDKDSSSTPSSTPGEASSSPNTTEDQQGLTYDPKSDPGLLGADIKPLSEQDIMELTFGGGAVRAYLDFMNGMIDLGEYFKERARRERMERITERMREQFRNKAERDAGVKEADEAWIRARRNYTKIHKEMRDQEKIEGIVYFGLHHKAEELERRGDGPDDSVGKYGITRKQVYDRHFNDWLGTLTKTWAMQDAAAEAHVTEQSAMNEYMEARNRASQLQEQYLEEWGK